MCLKSRSELQVSFDANTTRVTDKFQENHSCRPLYWSSGLPKSKSLRRDQQILFWFAWLFIAVGVVNAISIISILIMMMVKYHDPVDSNFAFYKNTQFKECAAMVPDAANCSDISVVRSNRHPTNSYAELGQWYVLRTELETKKGKFDWCDMVSCFNDFKVIPSSANDRAMGSTLFSAWWFTSVSALSAVWAFKNLCPLHDKAPSERCKGLRDLGFLDLVFLIWDICGPTLWWWISFCLEVVRDDPRPSLSVIAWTVSWKYSYLIQYHPYWCSLVNFPKTKRCLSWALRILAGLQWTATLYIIYKTWTAEFVSARYSCLPTYATDWPGTSACSTEEVCSKDWLFGSPDFLSGGGSASSLIMTTFITSTLTLAYRPIGLMFLRLWHKCSPSSAIRRNINDLPRMLSPIASLAIWGASTLVLASYIGAGEIGSTWVDMPRAATVAIDYECHAVHVGLSAWRYYLDVNTYARPLRIAMMWFGV